MKLLYLFVFAFRASFKFADASCSLATVCIPASNCYYKGTTSLKWCDEFRSKVCCPKSNLEPVFSKNIFSLDFYEDGYQGPLSREAKRILQSYTERECGIRRSLHGKISTGHDSSLGIANYGEFPWQVAVLLRLDQLKGRTAYKFLCGGTVISPVAIITAAHCVTGMRLNKLKVSLGEWNLKGNQGELFPTIGRRVSKIITHEHYSSTTFDHDIAIFILNKPVNLRKTPHVSPICLPPVHAKFDEFSKCYIAGWGSDVYKPNYGSNVLKAATVTLLDDDCKHKLKENIPSISNSFLNRDLRCISGSLGKDACIGDGGGAVVCPFSNDKVPVCRNGYNCKEEHYFIAGVISWGSDKCGEDGSVTVVTDFQAHRDWVLDKAGKFGGIDLDHIYSNRYDYDDHYDNEYDYGHNYNRPHALGTSGSYYSPYNDRYDLPDNKPYDDRDYHYDDGDYSYGYEEYNRHNEYSYNGHEKYQGKPKFY